MRKLHIITHQGKNFESFTVHQSGIPQSIGRSPVSELEPLWNAVGLITCSLEKPPLCSTRVRHTQRISLIYPYLIGKKFQDD